jgi:hypothetical protein
MFAIIAAIIFGLALLANLLQASFSEPFTNTTLISAGLMFLALHSAGVYSGGWAWRGRRRVRR